MSESQIDEIEDLNAQVGRQATTIDQLKKDIQKLEKDLRQSNNAVTIAQAETEHWKVDNAVLRLNNERLELDIAAFKLRWTQFNEERNGEIAEKREENRILSRDLSLLREAAGVVVAKLQKILPPSNRSQE